MPIDQEKLFKLLEKTLNYTPIVYKQSSFNVNQEAFGTDFRLEYKFTDIPDDCMLFFVPIASCTGPSTLNVRTPSVDNNRYVDHIFEILVETNDGRVRQAKLGDIIAYRMCFFRFRKGTNKIILCNSPLYNEAAFSSIIAEKAVFNTVPSVGEDKLALQSKVESLESRIEALEKKIKFGTEDPEVALENEPAGTLYIRVGED